MHDFTSEVFLIGHSVTGGDMQKTLREIGRRIPVALTKAPIGTKVCGYNERQHCSPGFNIPFGCRMRTPHGEYPEYHTSADNLDFITPDAMEDTVRLALDIIDLLENNLLVRSLNPQDEPQLGKRGLNKPMGGDRATVDPRMAYLWVMNLADGEHHLLDMAERVAPGEEVRT